VLRTIGLDVADCHAVTITKEFAEETTSPF
jgi:hypothetical protein